VRKRPIRKRNGEFDALATGIAAGVRRPIALPRRRRGAALVRAASAPVSEAAAEEARVQLDLLPQHQFPEPPDTRASVAPGG
jgi:hypothetical protein